MGEERTIRSGGKTRQKARIRRNANHQHVIYATSVLLAERGRLDASPHRNGHRRVSDEGVVAFSVADFAEFTGRLPPGRKSGGALYRQIEQGLRRISGTRLETNLAAGGYRCLDLFGMIDRASIIRREKLRPDDDGVMLGCRIRLSEWMMEALNSNQVLKLDRDYFRLRRPLDRRIYQIVRKHCGSQEKWDIGLPKLHAKSGSRMRIKQFRYRIREFMGRWDERLEREDLDFLGYRLEYDPSPRHGGRPEDEAGKRAARHPARDPRPAVGGLRPDRPRRMPRLRSGDPLPGVDQLRQPQVRGRQAP